MTRRRVMMIRRSLLPPSSSMATVVVATLIASWLVATSLVQAQPLFDSISQIIFLEKSYSTEDVLTRNRTYRLQPDTVFQMGVFDSTTQTWVNGSEPILPRVNATVQCGYDGSSDDNCVLEGGWYGLSHIGYFSERVDRFLMQGITFRGQSLAAILLQSDGNITFVDCIIEEQTSSSPIVVPLSATGRRQRRRRRRLPWTLPNLVKQPQVGVVDNSHTVAVHNNAYNERQLQNVDMSLQVSFVNCLFRNNYYVGAPSDSSLFGPGVITVSGSQSQPASLDIQSCLFVNNAYGSNKTDGWAIQTNGPLSLQSNCWIDNNFWGPAPIRVLNNASVSQTDNFATLQKGDVTCPLVSVATALDFSRSSTTSRRSRCIAEQSSTCALLPPLPASYLTPKETLPPQTPTQAPTQAPTHAPIQAPINNTAATPTSASPIVTDGTGGIFILLVCSWSFLLLLL